MPSENQATTGYLSAKELLEQAARLRGQTLSAYALATLLDDAHRVIERADRLEVTLRDHRHFLATLERDDEPNEALVDAAQRYLARDDKASPQA